MLSSTAIILAEGHSCGSFPPSPGPWLRHGIRGIGSLACSCSSALCGLHLSCDFACGRPILQRSIGSPAPRSRGLSRGIRDFAFSAIGVAYFVGPLNAQLTELHREGLVITVGASCTVRAWCHAVVRWQDVVARVELGAAVAQDVDCGYAKNREQLLRDDLPVAISPVRLGAHVCGGPFRCTSFFPSKGWSCPLCCGCKLGKRRLPLGLAEQLCDAADLVAELRAVSVRDPPPPAQRLEAALLEVREAAAGWNTADIHQRAHTIARQQSKERPRLMI